MEITVLGSSSAGNCYAVDDGETKLLLECGLRFADIRRGVGFRVSGLAGVLLTHCHGDHAKAVRDVLKAGIDVYTSTGTAEALGIMGHHRLRVVCGVNAWDLSRSRAELDEIIRRKRFRIGTWGVLPFAAEHDAPEPLGFLLASGAEKLLYATDTSYIRPTFTGLTHLLIEANHSWAILRENVANGSLDPGLKNRILRSHMSLETLLEFLKANDLSRLQQTILIHLSDNNSSEDEFKAAIQRATGRPVYVARA